MILKFMKLSKIYCTPPELLKTGRKQDIFTRRKVKKQERLHQETKEG